MAIKRHTLSFVMIVSIILLIACIFKNVWMRNDLFIMGVNFIYDYQTHGSSPVVNVIQNLISLLCNPIGVGILLIPYYLITKRKLQAIVFVSYVIITTFIIAVMKQLFQDT